MAIELLSGVGYWENLMAAIDAGCDSVYFGVKELNMRMGAKNFEMSELPKIVSICHENKVRAYLTVNTIVFDDELDKVRKILTVAKEASMDAIICWDMGVVSIARELGHEIHLSTQASCANSVSAEFYKNQGISRIVFARELSLDRIKALREKTDIEIECFCHGALCISVSGRCFMSEYQYGKSANRGECLQTCRRAYRVTDIETGSELELENNYVLSPKDLCTIEIIDQMVDAGIDGFKIEGRNRPAEYVKTVTACYRQAIDAHNNGRYDDALKNELKERLSKVYNRGFTTGYYFNVPDFTDDYGSKSKNVKVFVGKIKNFYKAISVAELKINTGTI